MDNVARACELAYAGRIAEAVAHLEQAGASGDASAWLELAGWHFSGSPVPRDLRKGRDCYRAAGEAGSPEGRMIHLSLMASGVGGARDWRGALRLLAELARVDSHAARQLEILSAMPVTEEGDPIAVPASEALSERPRASVFRNLLSAAECDYLIDLASPMFVPAMVVDPATGRFQHDPIRISDTTPFPWIRENPLVHALNRRFAAASGTKVEAGEPLQVLRYRSGQQYRAHMDAIPDADNQRVLTLIVYLNAGFGGGETRFLQTGTSFVGAPGDALLFRNADEDGRPDPLSQHAGLPVTSGEKIIASRWIRQRPFGDR